MSQPVFPLTLVLLLMATAVGAQPSPPRERHERRVVLSANPADPLPEIRLAPGVPTLLLFEDEIERHRIKLDGPALVQIVDKGERSIILEPVTELRAQDPLVLRVPFDHPTLPEQAVLALVSHPSEVDVRVGISRRQHSMEACLAELSTKDSELAQTRALCAAKDVELAALRSRCEARGPADLVLAGLLDETLDSEEISGQVASESGLKVTDSWVTSTQAWMVVAIRVRNLSPQPWTPARATLTSKRTGEFVEVRAVKMAPPQLAPGAEGLVAVEAVNPPEGEAGKEFHLELVDAEGGRPLSPPRVKLK